MSFNVRIIYLQNSRIILQLHNPAHTILHLVSAKGFYSWDKAVFCSKEWFTKRELGLTCHPFQGMHNYIIIFLLSTVKYVLGVGYSIALVDNIIASFTVTILGSITGVYVFTFGGYRILTFLRHNYSLKKRVFTRTNRLIINFKKKGGLPLIALLTPIVLSIPIGCIAAVIIYGNRRKVVIYMVVSVLAWSILLFGGKQFFGLNLDAIVND